MAIRQKLLNMDEYFRSVQGNKIIINDLNYFSIDDIEQVNRSLMTVYDSDILSTVPSCDCGKLSGQYLLDKYCSDCGTQCKDVYDKVQPLMWLKSLENDLPMMNPDYWLMLRTILDKRIDYVRWMSDPKYNPPIELPNYIYGVKEILGERSYLNMINRLPLILEYLINHSKFKIGNKQDDLQLLYDMYMYHKHEIFSTYIPIINKKLFVMENTTKGKFINLAVSDVIDVVMMWIKTASEEKQSHKKNSITTAVVISKLATLYNTYFDKYLVKKIGAFRKHVYGARSHFTFRSVITSVPGKHRHDGIEVPWAIGVTVFRPHILNKLVKRGYTHKKASSLIFKGVKKYIPVLDEILQELIAEAPGGKLVVIAQRNPSLLSGSAQYVHISKFTTDPEIKTVAISALIIKSMNGDYDGDELNFIVLIDNLLSEEFKKLKPFYNIPDMSKPYSVCGYLTLLAPSNSLIANYLSDKSEYPEQDTISNKFKLLDI